MTDSQRRHHHRRRPQRPGLCGLPGPRGPAGAGAGGGRPGWWRCRHAGVRTGLPGVGLRAPAVSARPGHQPRSRSRRVTASSSPAATCGPWLLPQRAITSCSMAARWQPARLAQRIAQPCAEFHARMQRFARVLAKQHNRRPPRLAGGGRSELVAAALLGFDIRRLGRDDMREFLRIAGINVFDVLEETFDESAAEGRPGAGRGAGHQSRSALQQLDVDAAAPPERQQRHRACPAGGMGAVTAAIAAAARARGRDGADLEPGCTDHARGRPGRRRRARERREARGRHGRLQRRSGANPARRSSAPAISRPDSPSGSATSARRARPPSCIWPWTRLPEFSAAGGGARGRAAGHCAGPGLRGARLRSLQVWAVVH